MRLDVEGECLYSAHLVMRVQSAGLWCLQGARSLGLLSGSVKSAVYESKWKRGVGTRSGMKRAREGSKKEKREHVCLVTTVLASNSGHLTRENLA